MQLSHHLLAMGTIIDRNRMRMAALCALAVMRWIVVLAYGSCYFLDRDAISVGNCRPLNWTLVQRRQWRAPAAAVGVVIYALEQQASAPIHNDM